ncbi:MAG: hypothetical protein WBW74_03105 [Xanthobacteraceae bacterium]
MAIAAAPFGLIQSRVRSTNFAHVLTGKPVPTFPAHAPTPQHARSKGRADTSIPDKLGEKKASPAAAGHVRDDHLFALTQCA